MISLERSVRTRSEFRDSIGDLYRPRGSSNCTQQIHSLGYCVYCSSRFLHLRQEACPVIRHVDHQQLGHVNHWPHARFSRIETAVVLSLMSTSGSVVSMQPRWPVLDHLLLPLCEVESFRELSKEVIVWSSSFLRALTVHDMSRF